MKFEFYCNDGSPMGIIPEDIDKRGVGGAELALLSFTETLARRGHHVKVFNNPRVAGSHNGVEFRPNREFDPANPGEVFVLFRSPNLALLKTQAPVKLFWSCDQFTVGNYMRHVFPFVDQIVTISPFHRDYHIRRWKATPQDITVIDLGVRLWEYEREVERDPKHAIFCSVPERGLIELQRVWGKIVDAVPEAHLTITSDYTLWGAPRPLIHRYRLLMAQSRNVNYVGKVSREELVRLQLSSGVMAYPCVYDELFCIAAAECQVAGAIPITSDFGALQTTNVNGVQIPGDPKTGPWRETFIEAMIQHLTEDVEDRRETIQSEARKRFDWNVITDKWFQMIEQVQKKKGLR